MSLPVSQNDVTKVSIANIFLILRLIKSQFGQRDMGSPYDFEVI